MMREAAPGSDRGEQIPAVLRSVILPENILQIAAAGLILAGLYLLSLKDYLLFHSIV